MSSRAEVEARWARRSVSRESEEVVVVVELEGFGFGGAGEEGILLVSFEGVLCASRGVWELVWLDFVCTGKEEW